MNDETSATHGHWAHATYPRRAETLTRREQLRELRRRADRASSPSSPATSPLWASGRSVSTDSTPTGSGD
jgi:hypothetical protein